MADTEDIKKALRKKKKNPRVKIKDLLSTGSTLLNLALSGHTRGGLLKGRVYRYAGKSSTGKTFGSLTCFAEAKKNPAFESYRLIFDDAEGGAMMDFEKYFGKKVADAVEAPGKDSDGEPRSSETVEEFGDFVDDAVKEGTPFIYVLDSVDALSCEEEIAHAADAKKARRKGNKIPGTMGMSKAKKLSSILRRVNNAAKSTGSIIILISQTRDNVGYTATFEPEVTSGGRGMKFYASAEIWVSTIKKLTKEINGRKRKIGMTIRALVKKNRISGKEWDVDFPFYYSYGIDDIGGCIDFLLSEQYWKKNGAHFVPTDLFDGERYTRDGLIKAIEENNKEEDLRRLTSHVWADMEAQVTPERKGRYD